MSSTLFPSAPSTWLPSTEEVGNPSWQYVDMLAYFENWRDIDKNISRKQVHLQPGKQAIHPNTV